MSKKPIPQHHQKRLEILSAYIRELRFGEGMTQNLVGQEIDLHLNSIIRIENSKNFTILTLFELADYYEIPASEILSIID